MTCTTMTLLFYYIITNLGRMHSWQRGGDIYDDDDDDNNDDDKYNDYGVNGGDNDGNKNDDDNIIFLHNNQP